MRHFAHVFIFSPDPITQLQLFDCLATPVLSICTNIL